MYARVFSGQLQPNKIEEATQLVQDSIIPVAQQQQGFKNLLWLIDRNTGKGMIISLWESEATRSASETNGFLREQLAKLATVVVGPPTTERFEVGSQT
jgi:hypothetical protein